MLLSSPGCERQTLTLAMSSTWRWKTILIVYPFRVMINTYLSLRFVNEFSAHTILCTNFDRVITRSHNRLSALLQALFLVSSFHARRPSASDFFLAIFYKKCYFLPEAELSHILHCNTRPFLPSWCTSNSQWEITTSTSLGRQDFCQLTMFGICTGRQSTLTETLSNF